ncbi:MAG TPA: SDR family NAD(P)-dependent oxidoreductase, partial [Draconibacterium sp.]|nr:SDR family NAD(P)-dependent oxidoreductase [Draconibacterium sp.]
MKPISFDDLKGKVCVITGGAGVLGNAMVKALASVDMKIVIADINKEVADAMAAEIAAESNATVIGIEANVLDKASLEKAKAEINEKLGDIDVLINGAGGNSPQATTKVEQMTEENIDKLEDTFYGLEMEGFDKVFALNFKGTLLPTMVFTTDMLK